MVQVSCFRVYGCRVEGAGLRVQGAGCRVQGAGCRVQGSGCRVQGVGNNPVAVRVIDKGEALHAAVVRLLLELHARALHTTSKLLVNYTPLVN